MQYSFNGINMLALGDIMLDRFWEGSAERVSPEAPVPIVNIGAKVDKPGGVGNVAANIKALGANVTCLGLVGEDEAGSSLQDKLAQLQIKSHLLPQADAKTIVKLRVLCQHQQLIRLDFEHDFTNCDKQSLLQAFKQALSECHGVVLSDYGKGTLTNLPEVICLAADKPVIIDPYFRDFAMYRHASAITPNIEQLRYCIGDWQSEAHLEEKVLQLLQRYAIGALLLTRGKEGISLYRHGQDTVHMPSTSQAVYDVTGASDTVAAVFATAYAGNYPLNQAARLANTASSMTVMKLGTATVSAMELARDMVKNVQSQSIPQGVLSLQQLQQAVSQSRAAGETIVMTNGCFDLLHVGHITYLQQAKQKGDRLLVAINSDDSIKRLKGVGRPIMDSEARANMLANLAAVDWVVVFTEDTPDNVIEVVAPDILVKGTDYQQQDIVGGDKVIQKGGWICAIKHPFEHVSTSRIVKIIKRAISR